MLTATIKQTALAAALAALVSTSPASAQRVEPMRFELAPNGTGAQQTVTITNTKPFPITIETVASTLAIDESGVETLAPADDDFLIFPPQAVIEAGKSQSIRVRYIGDSDISGSRAYRIGFNQLPIDMSESGESGVAITVNFATLVNIVPNNARSDLTVSELSDLGNGRWRMLVDNNGNRYARMPDTHITFAQDGKVMQYTSGETRGWFDNILILPGNQLSITLPEPEGFEADKTTITLVEAS